MNAPLLNRKLRAVALTAVLAVACRSGERAGAAPQVFRIEPVRPVVGLLAAAGTVPPPRQPAGMRSPDLVELVALDPSIRLEIRYATRNNFLGTPVYAEARAFLQRPAAEAVVRAHRALARHGYGTLVYDAYRPWSVTWVFWEATPSNLHEFVADPAQGSRHNRGCAVDLGLYELASGALVAMPSGYDEMTERAHAEYPGGTGEERAHRDLLRGAMDAEGFAVYPPEWWHYDYRDWSSYPVLNVLFADIPRVLPAG